MEQTNNKTTLSRDSYLSSQSFLIQNNAHYSGLTTQRQSSRFKVFPQDPLYKFPVLNRSLPTEEYISQADAVDMKSSLTILKNRSPFAEENAPIQAPQNSMESFHLASEISSYSYRGSPRSDVSILSKDREAILGIQKNFVLQNENLIQSMSMNSFSQSFFSDDINFNASSIKDWREDSTYVTNMPARTFLVHSSASRELLSRCPDFPPPLNRRPECPDGNSPLYRKLVICQLIIGFTEAKAVDIVYSLPVSGFTSRPTIIYSSYPGRTKGVIGHSPSSALTLLYTASILHTLINRKVTWVSCGFEHSVALTKDGQVYSWGLGASGCLGNGSNSDATVPALLDTLNDITYIECGAYHTAAISYERSLYTWGRNDVNQLGINNDSILNDRFGHVALVPMLAHRNAAGVACGEAHTIVIDSYGKLCAFGWNQDRQTACESSLSFAKISAGGFFSAGIDIYGRLFVWGCGEQGQLGLGKDVKAAESPTLVESIREVAIDVVCGETHTVCLCDNGSIYAWGTGIAGEFPGAYEEGTEIICYLPRKVSQYEITHKLMLKCLSSFI